MAFDRKIRQCCFTFMEYIGRLFFTASLFYLAVGAAMGFAMAFLRGKWTLRLMPAHTHINLFGWTSMLIFGFAYSHLPQLVWPFGALVIFSVWLFAFNIA